MVSKRQIEACRRNWSRWSGVSAAGRDRLRQACLRDRPWERSTGPRTEAGKQRSRANAVFYGDHTTVVEPDATLREIFRLYRRLVQECLDGESTPAPPPGRLFALTADADAVVLLVRLGEVLGLPITAEEVCRVGDVGILTQVPIDGLAPEGRLALLEVLLAIVDAYDAIA